MEQAIDRFQSTAEKKHYRDFYDGTSQSTQNATPSLSQNQNGCSQTTLSKYHNRNGQVAQAMQPPLLGHISSMQTL